MALLRPALFLIVAIALVYAPVVTFDFINYDDEGYILINPWVNSGIRLANIHWAFTEFYMGNWHPLTWISHMLDVELYGLNSGGHHLTSLLLHSLNTLLLLYFLVRLGFAMPAATAMAALFALHPTHVESVVWIAERKDVLSTFFMLLTLLAYLRFSAHRSLPNFLLVFGLFGMGLLCKSMLVTLPFVLLLLDFHPLKASNWWIACRDKLPLLMLSGLAALIAVLSQSAGNAIEDGQLLSLLDRMNNAAVAYSQYVLNAFAPSKLSVFYPHPGQWSTTTVLLSYSLLISITAIVVMNLVSRPYMAVGWFWFLGTLVPVIGMVQIGSQFMADRYTYIPYIGLFMAVVPVFFDLTKKVAFGERYFLFSMFAILLMYGLTTAQYSSHWRNSISLFTHTLLTIDANYVNHQQIISSEVSTYEIANLKGYTIPYYNLGLALARKGLYADALFHFEIAEQLSPGSRYALFNKAMALAALGKTEHSLATLEDLLKQYPDYADARDKFNALSLLPRQPQQAP